MGAAVILRLAIGLLCAALMAPAFAAIAYWTGNVKYVTTVTYQQGVSCEYNYAGNTFWRTFVGMSCPSQVSVQ